MNIEKVIIAYLAPLIPDVRVSGDVPNPRPEKLVTVERTGGEAANIVCDYPRLAIQCWASSRAKAAELAYKVDDLLLDIDDPSIPDISRSGLYNFPDEAGNPRYQITYDIIAYR